MAGEDDLNFDIRFLIEGIGIKENNIHHLIDLIQLLLSQKNL